LSLWIARAERTISDEIPAPPDQVRDFYVDLDNIGTQSKCGGDRWQGVVDEHMRRRRDAPGGASIIVDSFATVHLMQPSLRDHRRAPVWWRCEPGYIGKIKTGADSDST